VPVFVEMQNVFHKGSIYHPIPTAMPAQSRLGMDPVLLTRVGAGDYPIPFQNLLTAQSLMPPREVDSIIQVHRRKMQRRQANRKSAQLSRARKKAHLEELKEENFRLQKLVNVLESLPEFVFSFNAKGTIIYIPESLSSMIKSAADDPDEEIVHINQILTPESVNTLYESINEIVGTGANDQAVTFVKEVFYQDATGFPVAGYMRCSRVIRTALMLKDEDLSGHAATESDSESCLSEKLKKKRSLDFHDTKAEQMKVIRKDSCDTCDSSNIPSEEIDEFICVIRPASASSPHGLNNLHLLSAASMVAHDSHQRCGSDKDEKRRMNGTPSDGSHSSVVPRSSVTTHTTEQTKNSTSSEAGSEDNPSSEPST
jgi:hypothetical protein